MLRREFNAAIAEYDEGRRGLDISYARCLLEHGRVLLALVNRRYSLAARRAAARRRRQ